MNSFENLIVWEKAHKLTLEIYKHTSEFPKIEIYGIVNQMRRAAYSIPSNIVEGNSRKSNKEFLQFLNIAKGSLEELKYFLLLSKDLNYISLQQYSNLNNMCEEVSKLLYKFTKSIEKSIISN